jgi:hypothetical protein
VQKFTPLLIGLMRCSLDAGLVAGPVHRLPRERCRLRLCQEIGSEGEHQDATDARDPLPGR